MKKQKIIKQFVECIPFEQIEAVLGKREYNKFMKWMRGQTVPMGGVFRDDLERYLKGLPVID